MKNKLAAILLAALVASGTLAGCGGSVSDTAQSVAANESAAVASADVSAEEKAALDADYLHSVSLKTDVGIFIESISYVLLAKDVHEGKSE